MLNQLFSPIGEVIEDIRQGKMIILFDDERECEGDFVMAASMVTAEAINFMMRNGSGIICLALTKERASQLDLKLIESRNTTSEASPCCAASIDASCGITSGVSAADRAVTIRAVTNVNNGASSIKVPGHVFPIVASPGGVLERAGHTESSLELMSYAGVYPAAAVCEVMNSDGNVASIEEISLLSKKYGIKMGLVRDVVEACRELIAVDSLS